MPFVTALSIARPLVTALVRRPFQGRVVGIFERSCNVMDGAGRVLAITLPEIGNGPFTVVISRWEPGLLATLARKPMIQADFQVLQIAEWQITWQTAPRWEARVPRPSDPVRLSPAVIRLLRDYQAWPPRSLFPGNPGGVLELAGQAAARLQQALRQEALPEIVAAASALAGLGPGLTPAGDDYLLGVMAALWLTGQVAALPAIAGAASPKTTSLSACFLQAAARGELAEPWHYLVLSLAREDAGAIARGAERIAGWGASSGRAALAGFAATLLETVPVS